MKRGGNIITSPVEIADTFADYYANILRDSHKKGKPGEHKKRKKEKDLLYNKPFTRTEKSHKTTKNTAPGEGYHQRH